MTINLILILRLLQEKQNDFNYRNYSINTSRVLHRLQNRRGEKMINNNANIQSLENSILVYSDYKQAVITGHLTDELKQEKIQELENQIAECQNTIDRLKVGANNE